MIGPVHFSSKSDRVWVVLHTISFAKFYIEELGNVVGGHLHIVLSDGNTNHGHVRYCLEVAEKAEDWVGAALAKVLLELSEEEIQQVYEALNETI